MSKARNRFQQLTPQERETLAAFPERLFPIRMTRCWSRRTRRRSWTVWPGRWSGRTERRPPVPRTAPMLPLRRASKPVILLAVSVILCAHLIYDKHKGKSS
ncbi:MAG: hypothetical protein ACLUJG_10775 [Lawsonibacter sp.]